MIEDYESNFAQDYNANSVNIGKINEPKSINNQLVVGIEKDNYHNKDYAKINKMQENKDKSIIMKNNEKNN